MIRGTVQRLGALRRGVHVLVLLVVHAGPAAAQSRTTGMLEGVVHDPTGGPVAGALVRVEEASSGATRSDSTAGSGQFLFQLLPPGEYDVRVERLGFRPRLVRGIFLRPGDRVDLTLTVAPGEGTFSAVDTTAAPGLTAVTRAGPGDWLTDLEMTALPERGRELRDLRGYSTLHGPSFAAEGLPAHLGGVAIDGMPHRPFRHPHRPESSLSDAFTIGAFRSVELVRQPFDIEWSGFTAPFLSAHTLQGTAHTRVRGFGAWSVADPPVGAGSGAADGRYSGVQAGLFASGPVVPDTLLYAAGIEVQRLQLPSTAESPVAAAALPGPISDALGLAQDAPDALRPLRADLLSAFGRVDWWLASGSLLRLSANLAPGGASRWHGPDLALRGSDLSASATLTTPLRRRWALEAHAGLAATRRDYDVGSADVLGVAGDRALPWTRLVDGGVAFGAEPTLPASLQRADLIAGMAVHTRRGAHQLKLGLTGGLHRYDYSYAQGRLGEFVFGGVEEFTRGEGAFVQAVGPLPAAGFRVQELGFHVQDAWGVRPGVELLVGLRQQFEWLPAGRLDRNDAWLERTGLANDRLKGRITHPDARLGLRWNVGNDNRWLVHVLAAIDHDRFDPAVLGELLTHDGRVHVRRGVGDLGPWPALPDSTQAPVLGPRLTLVGPEFRPPRSRRLTLGVLHRLRPGTAAYLRGVVRRTDFLARRHDLNLVSGPVAHDQHGRPVYGLLEKQGAALVALPGSNRRFSGFDVVSALDADGRSTFIGVTAGLEHRAGDLFTAVAEYTYSETTDDWVGAGARALEAELTPFPDSLNARDWAAGTSDFDVPHRLLATAELKLPLPASPRAAAVYRYRSGTPFTPRFRTGVDANGDGSASNDPAFVDDRVPGSTELLDRWECLRQQLGRFAERNACRRSGVHRLDIRLAVELARWGGSSAELVVDGLDLLDRPPVLVDEALYLLDPDRGLVVDRATAEVTLPLVANPGFGRRLAPARAGRMLRLGLRLGF